MGRGGFYRADPLIHHYLTIKYGYGKMEYKTSVNLFHK